MDQGQKDAMFALGFMDGKTGKSMLEGESDQSPATVEYRKGHQAGAAAARRVDWLRPAAQALEQG